MAGRHRKAIYDIEILYRKDPNRIFDWLRGIHKSNLDIVIMVFMERWINSLDKKTYLKIKAVTDQAIKDLEPAQPDNVIQFPQAMNS